MKTKVVSLIMVLLILGFCSPAHALLNAVGPNDPANGFPGYYQDPLGQALQLCFSTAIGPNGPMCSLLPDPGFDPTQPIVFPLNAGDPYNFPGEAFWIRH